MIVKPDAKHHRNNDTKNYQSGFLINSYGLKGFESHKPIENRTENQISKNSQYQPAPYKFIFQQAKETGNCQYQRKKKNKDDQLFHFHCLIRLTYNVNDNDPYDHRKWRQ